MSSLRIKQDFTDHFVPWLKALLGGTYPVIVLQPNSIRPAQTYLGVQVTSPLQKPGFSDDIVHKTGDIYEISGQRRMVVSVSAYLVKTAATFDVVNDFYTAQDLLERVRDAIEDPKAMESLRSAGIAIWSAGDILDLTELVESGFESRAHLDLVIGIASNRESGLGYINQVEITGSIEGSDEEPTLVNL